MSNIRLNSGKKVQYSKEICEAVVKAKTDISKACEEMYAVCGNIRMAVVDRAYDNLADIADKTIECANAVVRTAAEDLIEPLTKDTLSGAELTRQTKALMPELEACYTNVPEISRIPKSVTDARGMDENWTEASRAAFEDACKTFITVRQSLILTMGDITTKCKEEDSEGAYMKIGKATEEITNSTVTQYTALQGQLEEAGIMVSDVFKQAESAGARIAAVGEANAVSDILSADMDV